MALVKYAILLVFLSVVLWLSARLFRNERIIKSIDVLKGLLIFLFLLEAILNVCFRIEMKSWIFYIKPHPNRQLFESHPYTVVSNKKALSIKFNGVKITHDKSGYRNPYYSDQKLASAVRIAAIGGSTTYGVGVNNNETWPGILKELTGSDTLVLNTAVPGHSSVENLVTAALYLDDISPDIILLHTGLNDLRVSHVKHLATDYSNFHQPHLAGSMGLCYLEALPKIATIFYTVRVMQKLELYPVCDFHRAVVKGKVSKGVDKYALSIYRNNLKKLIHMCSYYSPDIIVIPQVLLPEKVKDEGLKWWIPFVPADELSDMMVRYNQVSKQVCDSTGAIYLEAVDRHKWLADDFVDPSHMNHKGNRKLAILILEEIRDHNR